MTQIIQEVQTCSVCGSDVTCSVLLSTNTMGGPDFDLRPAEMQRSTMDCWLQECSKCSSVNNDLSTKLEDAERIIEGRVYQALLVESDVPELARRFVRFALLNETDNHVAGTSYLRAAWVCDDATLLEQAVQYRNMAADNFLKLAPFEDNEEGVTRAAVLVDVLRRANRFEESRQLANSLCQMKAVADNDVIAAVLKREIELCDQRDTNVYVIEDVMEVN